MHSLHWFGRSVGIGHLDVLGTFGEHAHFNILIGPLFRAAFGARVGVAFVRKACSKRRGGGRFDPAFGARVVVALVRKACGKRRSGRHLEQRSELV